MTDARPLRTYLALAAPGIAGTALALYATSRYGAGATSDSADYVAAARSLAAGAGLLKSDLEPFTAWPPLFPSLLALLKIIAGLDPLQSARWLNACCFGITVFLGGAWIYRRSGSRAAAAVGALTVLFSLPLALTSRMIWSEPLFIVLATGALMAFDSFMKDTGRRSLYLAAALAGTALITRYAGAALVLTGLALVMMHRQLGFREKVGFALMLAAISMLPALLWVARNFMIAGSFSGHQYPLSPTPGFNLVQTAAAISKWLLPPETPGPARVLISAALLSAPAALYLYRNARDRQRPLVSGTFLALILFFLIYTGLLAFTRSRLVFHLISDRYLAPLYVPLAVYFMVFGYEAAAAIESKRRGSRARLVFLVLVGVWLLYPGWRLADTWGKCHRHGAGGYAGARWQQSETARYLRESLKGCDIFSNDPHAAYLLAGVNARWSAYKHPYARPAGESNLSRFLQSAEGNCLAWFDYPPKRFYTAAELEQYIDLELSENFADGAVYKMGRPKATLPGP